MAQALYPVGDGIAIGDWQVVGGVERFAVLNPFLRNEDAHVCAVAQSGLGFDLYMRSQGPIEAGECQLKMTLARLAGEAEIQVGAVLWDRDPRFEQNPIPIAQFENVMVTHDEWRDYTIRIIGRRSDEVALKMGKLWIRLFVIAVVNGPALPTIGVSSAWIETPDSPKVAFVDPSVTPPPEDTLVGVQTFSGRAGVAKQRHGEWFNEADQPFEADSTSQPEDSEGKLPLPIAINGWGGARFERVASDSVSVSDQIVSEFTAGIQSLQGQGRGRGRNK